MLVFAMHTYTQAGRATLSPHPPTHPPVPTPTDVLCAGHRCRWWFIVQRTASMAGGDRRRPYSDRGRGPGGRGGDHPQEAQGEHGHGIVRVKPPPMPMPMPTLPASP